MKHAALKSAGAALVHEVGGLEAAAGCVRVQKSVLAEGVSFNRPDRFLAVDVICDLETIWGTPLVTMALARAQGYRLERIEAGAGNDIVGPASRVGRHAAELSAALLEALQDGRIDAGERDRMLAHATAARDEADAVLAALNGDRQA